MPTETKYKYKFQLSTPHDEEFSRWMWYEAYTAFAWNPELIKMPAFEVVEFKPNWLLRKTFDHKIIIESNKRLFSLRKGLRFNCEKETLLIG